MEFNFSALFATVGIDIFDSDNIRNIFDNFNNAVDFIYFNDIDEFLLEELNEPCIAFYQELGIFFDKLLHLYSQHVDQMFCSSIRDWHLDNSIS